jgi:stearoyl-CoA desaturase (delta-9 desaturase)
MFIKFKKTLSMIGNHSLFRNSIFIGFHFLGLFALWSGVSAGAAIFGIFVYLMTMFGITAGYHRYFSHRSFKTSRPVQFMLALMGTLSLQKGVLHWAANHRDHHKYSDKPEDLHSPVQKGFWWSHVGWIMSDKYVETRWNRIKDFAKFPELKWLNRNWMGVFIVWCLIVRLLLGFDYLVWGCFIATLLGWHMTFCVNSLLHVWGKKVYPTKDESRNNFILAIPTLGEAWHSNHHYFPSSIRQGFHWYQIDLTYYVLWAMEKLGLIWDVVRPNKRVLEGNQANSKQAEEIN